MFIQIMAGQTALATSHSLIVAVSSQTTRNVQVITINLLKHYWMTFITVESVYQNHVRSVNGMTWATVEQHVAEDTKNKFGTYY